MINALSLVLVAHVAPQPMPPTYRSLEVMALSGASIVGVATRIQPPAPGGEQIKVCVVFKDVAAISGHVRFPEVGAFLTVSKEQVEDWITNKARILSFNGGAWLNLDDPDTRFIDARLNSVKGVDEALRRMRATFREHPEIEMVRSYYRPVSVAEAERLRVPRDARIAVPLDKNVERWAIGCIGSKDWETRLHGVDALGRFESPENAKRLKGLLSDPFYSEGASGTVRYPVRARAQDILTNWGIKP